MSQKAFEQMEEARNKMFEASYNRAIENVITDLNKMISADPEKYLSYTEEAKALILEDVGKVLIERYKFKE